MQIQFVLHPHLYAEDELQDWAFNDTENCGILSPEEFGALWNHRDYEVPFSYDEETTIGEVLKFITNVLIEDIYDDDDQFFFSRYFKRVYFLGGTERYHPNDNTAVFQSLLEKYFDPEQTGIVHIEILASIDAGNIWRENSLRFDMHSHEGNRHNEPHVHVWDKQSDEEASISLSTLIILDGSLSSKSYKKAKSIIRNNQDYFITCWNDLTDGLALDIDHHLGLINY